MPLMAVTADLDEKGRAAVAAESIRNPPWRIGSTH
jgi:hypothetical protein